MESAIKIPLSDRINLRMIAFFGVLLVLIGYPVYIYLDSAVHGGILLCAPHKGRRDDAVGARAERRNDGDTSTQRWVARGGGR